MNPSGAVAREPGGRARTLMNIGEVLSHLRTEFPDTTISKLRFLEAEGLVEPHRTASGYRKYSWNDVARLRFVLTAQRDQYLPLRVIREQLDAAPLDAAPLEAAQRGDEPLGRQRRALVAVGPDGDLPDTGPPVGPADVRVSRAELLDSTGVAEQTLTELEELGVVAPRPAGWYHTDAVAVLHAVAGLNSFGLELRHLRAFRTSADREVGLFAQLLAPLVRQNDPAAQARTAQATRELTLLSQRLHAALVRTGLRETLGR